MELVLQTLPGAEKSGLIDVSDKVLNVAFNSSLIHQAVTAYLAGARAGTRAQKTRAEVAGGKSKPWRQKGTGRARAGSSRSPLWRGGGVVFAAKPANYTQKLNKKMYRGAMCSLLSELQRQKRLIVVDNFMIDAPKTKSLVAKLQEFGKEKILIIVEQIDESLYLAARNLYHVMVESSNEVNPVTLVDAEKVIITATALKQLEEKLG